MDLSRSTLDLVSGEGRGEVTGEELLGSHRAHAAGAAAEQIALYTVYSGRHWPMSQGYVTLRQSRLEQLGPSEVRALRRALGLTQVQLGTALGVAGNTVARWERGESRIANAELVALALEQLASQSAAQPAHDYVPEIGRSAFTRRAPAGSLHNLPAERTSLIGRDQEVEAIRTALLESDGRLITLTGPGGVGKTRLAWRVGRDLVDMFPHGVWLVDLAPLTDPARLAQAAASVMGVHERPGEAVMDTLVGVLANRQILLVLDNCEHVLDACALLADSLLSGCERLRLLTTSREPLHLSGEVVWRVPPLNVPVVLVGAALDEVSSCAAVQLFADRARSIRPAFMLSADNASAVAHICALLEGLPLALELAARRVRVLGVDQILDQLSDSMRLLRDENRRTLDRHRTVEATLDWSYGLLNEPERAVFRRLAVFADGWTLEAAEAVCGDVKIPSRRVLDLRTQLVDKSLVVMEELEGHARYRLLEPPI